MRGSWERILNKTIKALVVTDNAHEPERQLIVVFDDDTTFEIFGRDFQGGNDLDQGGLSAAEHYAKSFGGRVRVIPSK